MSESDELDGMRAKIAHLESANKELTRQWEWASKQLNAWKQVAQGYAHIRGEGS